MYLHQSPHPQFDWLLNCCLWFLWGIVLVLAQATWLMIVWYSSAFLGGFPNSHLHLQAWALKRLTHYVLELVCRTHLHIHVNYPDYSNHVAAMLSNLNHFTWVELALHDRCYNYIWLTFILWCILQDISRPQSNLTFHSINLTCTIFYYMMSS